MSVHKKAVGNFVGWIRRNLFLAKRPDGKFMQRQEKRTIARFNKIFKAQMEWVIEAMKDLSFFETNRMTNAPVDEIDIMLDLMPGKANIANGIVAGASITMLKGGKSSVKKHNLGDFGISFSLTNPDAVRYLDGRKALELSDFRGNITGTTKARLADIISEAAQKGESYTQTATKIRQQGKAGVFSKSRSELIAARELGHGYEIGSMIPVKTFQRAHPERTVLKFWRTVGDDRVTVPCNGYANMSSDGILLAEPFVYEGAEGSFSDEHAPRNTNPRCRCYTDTKIQPPKK